MNLLLPLFVTWNVDPVFFSIFGIEVRYYGLTWALALAIGLYFFYKIMQREKLGEKALDSIFWYVAICMILGSRLGHLLFYDFKEFISNPVSFFYFRQGGFASHGAALGILLGLWLFSRRSNLPYVWSLDRIGIVVAIGGAAIRLGNLMNSEIYGGPTDLPWGFIFVRDGQTMPMHPTQIYEALSYLALFFVLWFMYFKKDLARKIPGLMTGVFLTWLFLARFLIEFIKNPQVEFEQSMALNMGQWLSIPFILVGIGFLVWSYLNHKKHPDPVDPAKNSRYYMRGNTKKK